MIIGVSDDNIEYHSPVKFFKILLNMATVPDDEINNIGIAETGRGIVAVFKTEQCQRRSEMNSFSIIVAVESL